MFFNATDVDTMFSLLRTAKLYSRGMFGENFIPETLEELEVKAMQLYERMTLTKPHPRYTTPVFPDLPLPEHVPEIPDYRPVEQPANVLTLERKVGNARLPASEMYVA